MRLQLDHKRNFQDHSPSELFYWGMKRIVGLSTGRFRILPDFILIGAQRSGTTSLFNYLSQHPEIHPSFPKEIHYFSNHYHKGEIWYRSHFPLRINIRKSTYHYKRNFITGEATPYYLIHPCAAERTSKCVPDVQLIVLLRNPVDRAYSHYHHQVKMGTEILPFKEAINMEDMRISGEIEKTKNDEKYRSLNLQNYSYLYRGIYFHHLQTWLRFFDREQLLILESEQFFNNPSRIIEQVYEFLGVSGYKLNGFRKYHHAQYPPMEPSLRKMLTDYFSPYNKQLFDYLNINPFWNDI